jgi:tRNA (guanine6-N2)-methyltransferase
VAADELRARLPGVAVDAELRPHGLAGHVVARADHPDPAAVAITLRTVNHVVRPLRALDLPAVDGLAAIRATFADLAPTVPELAPTDAVFRVRSRRTGAHPFTSEDVERVAGAGVRDALPRGVRLRGPAVELRCDVREGRVLVGLDVPVPDRPVLPFRPTTSLRPQLAAGLLALARPHGGPPPAAVLDPFAGGGTILAEAAARWPGVTLAGSDLQARCADGVRANLAALGAPSEVRTGDARAVDAVWPEGGFDTVVTNPPFGERLGKEVDLVALYHRFLASVTRVTTPDARLVVLALHRGRFNHALRAEGSWDTRHVRIVELGGRYAGAFVLARRG